METVKLAHLLITLDLLIKLNYVRQPIILNKLINLDMESLLVKFNDKISNNL